MPSSTLNTPKQTNRLLAVIAILYILSLTSGFAMSRLIPEAIPSSMQTYIQKANVNQIEQIEKVFGKYRQSLREGQLGTIAVCSGIVFGINLLGDFVQFTLYSILIVPVVFTLAFGGWIQGIGLAGIHGSSFVSVVLFLLMGFLEWSTYVIATAAGINIGLSFVFPRRQGVSSRRQAFKRAWKDGGRLYGIISLILAVQAVFEVLYVRKVLLMGGSGVPLMPY
ncbi:MAG: stage II sporulation protein M [Candidatus Latescibacter sp.]|nr:stage II sporulation protein M [Candidatus Latescibacter sp.]